MLFHKDGKVNVGVTDYVSHFYMFVPTKGNIKLANGNTAHSQVIGIILCSFPNLHIIYPVVSVYYFPDHPYNTILLVALKCYVIFQNVTSETLEHCEFLTLEVLLDIKLPESEQFGLSSN